MKTVFWLVFVVGLYAAWLYRQPEEWLIILAALSVGLAAVGAEYWWRRRSDRKRATR